MRGIGRFQIAREISISALIIALMLACSSFMIIVHALSGDLIWKKTSNPSSDPESAYGVAVDGTGVYIVGYDRKPGDSRWRMEKRALATGSLLWKKTSNPSSGEDFTFGVAVEGTGIYIVGYDEKPGNRRWRIEKRSTADGSLTWKKTSNPSTDWDEARGVAVDGTSVYIVGFDSKPGVNDWRWKIEKRSGTDGSLIWTKTGNPSTGWDEARGVAVDGSGVYIAGYDYRPSEVDSRWRIEKRSLTDGSIIWKKTSNPSSGEDFAVGVAVDGTGVYIVGYESHPSSTDTRWRMEKRSLTDGNIIWKKTSNPSSGIDRAYDVAVDGTSVYIVGDDSKPGAGNLRWRIEKRSTTDGSLIWKKAINPSSSSDIARCVAVDGSGVYIAGLDSRSGNGRWRIEKRQA